MKKRRAHSELVHAFFGVAFLGVAFFVAVFLGAAFFAAVFLGAAAAGALVFVTRPDLVLPRTRETSFSTAGAGAAAAAAAVLRGLPALALGLAVAAAFFGAAFAAVFLGAAAFLVVVVVALAFYRHGQHRRSWTAVRCPYGSGRLLGLRGSGLLLGLGLSLRSSGLLRVLFGKLHGSGGTWEDSQWAVRLTGGPLCRERRVNAGRVDPQQQKVRGPGRCGTYPWGAGRYQSPLP